MSEDQFAGAYLSVVESIAKLVATGFSHTDAYLSFQEYFERLRDVPERWGKPAAAVLGALMAQADLGVGAIGGKDSMSGSFEDLDVPPRSSHLPLPPDRLTRLSPLNSRLPVIELSALLLLTMARIGVLTLTGFSTPLVWLNSL